MSREVLCSLSRMNSHQNLIHAWYGIRAPRKELLRTWSYEKDSMPRCEIWRPRQTLLEGERCPWWLIIITCTSCPSCMHYFWIVRLNETTQRLGNFDESNVAALQSASLSLTTRLESTKNTTSQLKAEHQERMIKFESQIEKVHTPCACVVHLTFVTSAW